MVPLILSGGFGTRLWPLSRRVYPKQFHTLYGDLSLLQNTVKRALSCEGCKDPVFVCNDEHRFILAEQVRALSVTPQKILLEPFGKNTAPAIALAAFALQDQDPMLLVCPCDHSISDEEAFRKAVETAKPLAQKGKLVAFGIEPTYPATGFGYIAPGENHSIQSFKEKPSSEDASNYIANGYLWNSGIFLFKASSYLNELKTFHPEIYEKAKLCIQSQTQDLDFARIDSELFEKLPNVSVDVAVMEKTNLGAVIPMSCGWSDLGSWKTLWSVKEKDADNNVKIGDVMTEQVNHCFLRSEEKLIVASGIEGLSVVETDDAILISKMDEDHLIPKMIAELLKENRAEVHTHKKVYRPWGYYTSLNLGEKYQVKKIVVNPGCKLSLQTHRHRSEHWVVVKGIALVTKGDKQFLLSENESTYISQGEVHRLENQKNSPLELIEVQTGSYLGEDDIVRLEDQYNR